MTNPGTWQPPLPAELESSMPGYAISELLGRGGMGAVYRGIQQSLDRDVAIKLLPPELASNPQFAARFEREAKAMAKLNHPNIVQIYDFGKTTQDHYFFVMEFVEGCDLHSYANSGKLSPADALVAVGQICSALQYAHDKGFVHRDIKPANIFLSAEGVLKVGDFGLAKLVEFEDTSELTLTGYAVGTPNYIAPEQLNGQKQVDHRADLYSLGIMFYEMLTGELPRGAVKPPSEKINSLDVRLDDVVFKAMDSEPDNRYQSATDLHSDVEVIRNSAEPETPPTRKKKKSSKKWIWIIATIVEVAIVATYFLFAPAKKASPKLVPGKLHAVGKMATGTGRALAPVDIKAATGFNDLVQVTGKFRGSWVALRENGSVISSSTADFSPGTGIARLGRRSGSVGILYYINQQGKLVSSNPHPAAAELIPDVKHKAIDVATHDTHGLVLYKNGQAIPFGLAYKESKWFRPDTSQLIKTAKIAVGENAAAVLKRDGSVQAWTREGYLELPLAFERDIVDIVVSASPGIIALDKSGRLHAAHGEKANSWQGDQRKVIKRLAGGDNLYSPPLYQTADDEWHLFEETKLRMAHPDVSQSISRLKGLPAEAFHIRMDSNASAEAYLLWIDP